MIALVLAGGALVVLVVVDVLSTVVAPNAHGPISRPLYRAAWAGARHAPIRVREPLMRIAGPGSMVVTIITWLAMLWVGYALIYLPFLGSVSFSPDARYGGRGLMEALYLSGVTLTTVGFGDVVPQSDVLRLVTILEAGSGLGVITAAIAFLPVIYTLLSDLRSSNRVFGALGAHAPSGAAQVVVHGGLSTLEDVRSDVIATREHLQRFPVLSYFHPSEEESPLALLRSATGVCVAVQWGVDHRRVPYAPHWGQALEEAVRQLLQDTALHLARDPARQTGSEDGAVERVEAVRAAIAALDPALAAHGPVPQAAGDFLALADGTIRAYAAMHGYPQSAVLALDDGRP